MAKRFSPYRTNPLNTAARVPAHGHIMAGHTFASPAASIHPYSGRSSSGDVFYSGMTWDEATKLHNEAQDRILALEDKVQALNEAKWQAEENVARMTEMFEELLTKMQTLENEVRRYNVDEETRESLAQRANVDFAKELYDWQRLVGDPKAAAYLKDIT